MTIFKSIRWTLQIWHAVLLLLVVCIFAVTTFFTLQHARMQRVDSDLHTMASVLAAEMRPLAPRRLRHEFGAQTRPAQAQLNGTQPERTSAEPPVQESGPGAGGNEGADGGGEPPNQQGAPRDNTHPFWPSPQTPEELDAFEMHFAVRDELLHPYETGSANAPYFAIWRSNGQLLQSSLPSSSVPSSPGVFKLSANSSDAAPAPAQVRYRQRGNYREAIVAGPLGMPVLVGRSITREENEQRTLVELLAITGAGVLALGLIGGWLLSKRAIKPIQNITAAAQSISASNLSRRINIHETESELGMMASVLNATFDRLQAAFEQQVRFTADASHELRTPLAVIYSHAELGLSKPRTAEEYRQIIETCLRASKRMKSLVDALLTLARADSGKLQVKRVPFDLASIVQESVELLRPLAIEKKIDWKLDIHSAPVIGDAFLMGQAVTNVVSNAIKYNRGGGQISVALISEAGQARLTIADTGAGISEEDQRHLFERFYRGDKSRVRQTPIAARSASGDLPQAADQGGTGLGLAICASIIAVHQGSIAVSSKLTEGSTFTILLPRAPQDAKMPPAANVAPPSPSLASV